MNAIGMILSLVGGVVGLVGFIWLVVVAFKESILWGIGCLLVPCVGIVFAIMNWEKAKKPFLIGLGGSLLASVGSFLMKPPAG
jgi:hypothetical protein